MDYLLILITVGTAVIGYTYYRLRCLERALAAYRTSVADLHVAVLKTRAALLAVKP
jgi:hypothetical protein